MLIARKVVCIYLQSLLYFLIDGNALIIAMSRHNYISEQGDVQGSLSV